MNAGEQAIDSGRPQRIAATAEHHPTDLDDDGDNGIEHRKENPAADHPGQGLVAMAGEQVTDGVGAGEHRAQGRRADQQRGERHQFDDHHQHQGPQHRLVHPAALAFHVFGQQHRRAVAVVGKQADAHRADHQCPGRQLQGAVIDDLRLQQNAHRLRGIAEAEPDDHQQGRHFQQQARAGDPGIELDIEDAQQITADHDHQGHGLGIEVRAQGIVQVGGGTSGQHRRNEQQHHQHREEGGITGHAAEHSLGVYILAAGAVVGAAQLGVAKGEHQGQQPGHDEGQEHPATGLMDGEGGDHEH